MFTLAQSNSEELVKLKAIYFLGVQRTYEKFEEDGGFPGRIW